MKFLWFYYAFITICTAAAGLIAAVQGNPAGFFMFWLSLVCWLAMRTLGHESFER